MRVHLPCLAVMLLAAPAQALGVEGPNTAPANCEELFTLSGLAEEGPATVIEAIEDGCRVSDFFIGSDEYDRQHIGSLTIEAPGLFEALAADLPPRQANISVTGIASAPRIDDPLLEYMVEVQSLPFDIGLAYRWDETAGVLTVDELSLSGAFLGRLTLSARIDGIEPDAVSADRAGLSPAFLLRLPPAFVFREAEIVLDNDLLVASFIAPLLIGMLSPDEDPRQQVATHQQVIKTTLENLPETIIDAGSKAVIAALIDSFPHPEGTYTIKLHAEDGISADMLDSGAALDFLSAVTIEATHSP